MHETARTAGHRRGSLTLRIQHRVVNPVVRALLRSPLHGVLSGAVMLITYVGRRSGAERTIPVMYARDADAVVVFVGWPEQKVWWRNLREEQRVRMRIRGRDVVGLARVVDEPALAERSLSAYLARFPRTAGMRGIPPGDAAALTAAAARAVLVRVELERP